MLYGYGDDRNPYTETVDFLEDLVFQFITDMTQKAMEIGRQNRVQVGNPDTSQYLQSVLGTGLSFCFYTVP